MRRYGRYLLQRLPSTKYEICQKQEKWLTEQRKLLLDGTHLEQRFKDRGFIDVKVFKKNIAIGEWNAKSLLLIGLFSR